MSNKPQFVGKRVKLGELISKAKVERCGGRSFPVYSMTMHDGIVEQSGRFKKAIASKDTSAYKVVKKNQLVVGFPIDEGVIYVQNHDQPGIMSPAYNVWDFDSSRIIPAYLELTLHSPQSMAYYAEKLRGTTARRRSLTAEGLRALPINLPSIECQRTVVEVLNGIKDQIAAAQKATEELDSLVKSQFVEMFGDPVDGTLWTRRRLSDLYEVKSSKRVYARELTEGGVPFLRLADIGSLIDSGMHTSGLFISEEKYNSLKERGNVPAPGDVLVTARGTLGRCYVIETSDRFYFQDGMITWLAAGEQSPLPRYLLSVFDDHHFIENLNRNCSGTTVKYLSISDLSNVAIPVPPLELQCRFTDFAALVDKSKLIAQQQIEKLQTLYDSLAQEYFS
ncbi:restriction endonuclease subunit S [Collinsella sp. SGI.178]|uniref:restriction endonuclease subunit S n=1 Tax=Collinsella sp. SGI.178 TaxID=3420554 RepID=UPI003D006519